MWCSLSWKTTITPVQSIWFLMLCIFNNHQAKQIHALSSSVHFYWYPFGKKDYKLLNLVTKDIFISRDVNFFFWKTLPFAFTSNANSLHPCLVLFQMCPLSFMIKYVFHPLFHLILVSSTHSTLPSTPSNNIPLRRTSCVCQPPSQLHDYDFNNVILEEEPFTCHHTVTNLYINDSLSHSPIPITEFIFHTQKYTTRTRIL